MTRKELVATLKGPGIELDITRRLKLNGLGTVTEGAEEELLKLTHGDMSLTLDDSDGVISGLFADATADDRWELIVLTETGRTRGLKWDRLFAGVLDLPWSVSVDAKNREVSIQVFSYTKALDLASATGVSRTVTGRNITITSGSTSATLNSTTDLQRGDQITARNATVEEQFIVDRVDSATTLRVKAPASNSFTEADLTLDTYFLRDQTVASLAEDVCDAASVVNRSVSLDVDLAAFPLAQPMATQGLGLITRPLSLIQQVGKIRATFAAADETKRKQTTDATVAWSDGATSNNFQADWRPYLNAEPGTIFDRAAGPEVSVQQDSNLQDSTIEVTASLTFCLAECVVYDSGGGAVAGDRFQVNAVFLISDVVYHPKIWLYKNGSPVVLLASILITGIPFVYPLYNAWIERDTVNHLTWVSYQVIRVEDTEPTRRETKYWDGSTITFVDAARSGQLRLCRSLGTSGFLVMADYPISRGGASTSGSLRFYDLGTVTTTANYGFSREIAYEGTIPLLWTLRQWDGVFAFLHTKGDGTYISTWRSSNYEKLSEYLVASKRESTGFLTVFRLPGGRDVGIGFASGEWFVVSRRLDGVVPYADFTDLSCAGALKELAIVSVSCLDTDRYNTVSLIQRPKLLSESPVQTLPSALVRTSTPIWEFYRTACTVSGTDSAGEDFEVTQVPLGVSGLSSKALEVSSPLITTQGMALAVAYFYAAYLGRSVKQEDIRIDEPEESVRVLDIVSFDDRRWLVAQVQTNVALREQTLKLFEVRG